MAVLCGLCITGVSLGVWQISCAASLTRNGHLTYPSQRRWLKIKLSLAFPLVSFTVINIKLLPECLAEVFVWLEPDEYDARVSSSVASDWQSFDSFPAPPHSCGMQRLYEYCFAAATKV